MKKSIERMLPGDNSIFYEGNTTLNFYKAKLICWYLNKKRVENQLGVHKYTDFIVITYCPF